MNGLIGFFDILGYQNFLKNNSATESALSALEIIIGIPKKVKEKVAAFANDNNKENNFDNEFSSNFKHLVFSDTIVFTLEYKEDADADWINRARINFSFAAALLTQQMFQNGLPMRGAIHEGTFIVQEMCFAGKGIVEAYQLCDSLNMSGLVFSESLGNDLVHVLGIKEKSHTDVYQFTYLTPLKDGVEKILLNVNWLFFLTKEEYSKYLMDTEYCVLESFWGHNKDCPISVDTKIRNTVKNIRKMLQNIELLGGHEELHK